MHESTLDERREQASFRLLMIRFPATLLPSFTGASLFHPVIHYPSMSQSLIDSIRACRRSGAEDGCVSELLSSIFNPFAVLHR